MNKFSNKRKKYSNFDWDAFATKGWDTLKAIFTSGKFGSGNNNSNTNTNTNTDTPAPNTDKGGDDDNSTMYWIIGGAAFVIILLVAVIAIKK